ncbi:hypothetical protein FDP41_001498 [Naegleria fowleri]|uniref:Hemerythrin-like domain-containing protein n=1 Tax=Naegleria fowleri TaxID=5763 RepID=A0A6A5C0V1_NAEFO|nr:uncharacterized protein FDP41_001498 [Naegleria fowleri]KAF0979155.1 hypothetical protein FDP41_001498 [Naegleria fowleri]CAG4715887.1 unnamed protein product [Naegleria fowleri]
MHNPTFLEPKNNKTLNRIVAVAQADPNIDAPQIELPSVLSNLSVDGLRYLIRDHNEVKDMFQDYLQGKDNSREAKLQIVRKFTQEICKHASAEERYLYPMLLEKLGQIEGQFIYRKNLLDDMMNKEMLRFLEQNEPKSELDWTIFDKCVRKFIQLEQEHMKEEEDDVFPLLRERMNDEELATLEDCLKWAKEHAPTHPHPFEVMTNPTAQLVHPLTAQLDAMRDAKEQGITSSAEGFSQQGPSSAVNVGLAEGGEGGGSGQVFYNPLTGADVSSVGTSQGGDKMEE